MKQACRNRYITVLVMCVAAAVLGLVLELACHFRAFSAGAENAERSIGLEQAEISGFTVDGDMLVLDGDDGYLRMPLDGRYMGQFAYDIAYDGAWNAYVKIGYANAYGDTTARDHVLVYDRNPSYLKQSIIPIDRDATYLELSVTREHLAELMPPQTDVSGSVRLGKFRALKAPGFNGRRFAFFWAAAFIAMILLVAFFPEVRCQKRNFVTEVKFHFRPEYGFLLVVLTFGVLISASLPANKIGWDEETHFAQSLWLANYRCPLSTTDVVIDQTKTGIATWPYNQPGGRAEMALWDDFVDTNGKLKGGDKLWSDDLNKRTMTGYVGSAAGIKLGQLLGLPFSAVFRLGRIGNLLVYAAAMFFAIRITPVGKGIFTFLALAPENIFLAAVYSYDATVTAFIYLAMAMLLHAIVNETRFTWKKFAAAAAVFSFGCAIKAVYAPLILVGLLIPKERFKDEKTARLMKAGFVLIFIAWILSFVLPVVFAPRDIGDLRGGATSEKGQMAYILGAPIAYAKVLFQNIWETFPSYIFGSESLVLLGERRFFSYPWMVSMGAAAVLVTDRGLEKNWTRRLGLFLASGACAVLVFTSMYIAFTPPGQIFIEGVQGRYYIPFLPLVWLAVNPDGICRLKLSSERYYALVCGMMAVILGACTWADVLNVFWR